MLCLKTSQLLNNSLANCQLFAKDTKNNMETQQRPAKSLCFSPSLLLISLYTGLIFLKQGVKNFHIYAVPSDLAKTLNN